MTGTSAFFPTVLTSGFLAVFLGVQAWLVRGVTEEMNEYQEPPPVAVSTHSLLYPEMNPEAAFDGDAKTFWWDRGEMGPDGRTPPMLLPYEKLYLLFSAGSTHVAGLPPRPAPLLAIGVRTGAGGAASREYARPRRIRLSYFEQQLYEINQDYRFPDQPVFVTAKEFLLEDRPGEQLLPLDFLPQPRPSRGFPDQVKERWFRLEILEVYQGTGKSGTAISEVRLIGSDAHSPGSP